MPIFEYQCSLCGGVFEKLIFPWEEQGLDSQCPSCNGMGKKVISAPAIVFEDLKTRMSVDRLPNWHENNRRAEVQDAWTRSRMKKPLPTDLGAGTKTYESEGLVEPK